MPRQRTPAFQVSQSLLDAVSKVLLSVFRSVFLNPCNEGECGCNAQLESEGTSEDGRQENSVPANESPTQRRKNSQTRERQLRSSGRKRGDVLVDNVGDL